MLGGLKLDLREFIAELDKTAELRVVNGADWNLEVGTITELSGEIAGPALLFNNIKGYPEGYRIITNVISTPRRLAIALSLPVDISPIELVRLVKEKFKELKPIPPVEVTDGPVLQNIQENEAVDMSGFPAPKWHEHDGGRYIGTGDMVIMRDPDENWVNVGDYRVQLHDRDTLGLSIAPGHHGRLIREKYWARGQSCPVAIVLGAHPVVWLPAFSGLPWGISEYDWMGGLLGEPVPVITGEYTGLPIPADAELAIEGELLRPEVESRKEGPFGEWPGYYASGARTEPVIKVKRTMYRNTPILVGAPPLKPPSSGTGGHIIQSANIWRDQEKLGIPGIRGVWHLRPGGSRYLCVISIKQEYAGHAKQVAMAAMSGLEGGYMGRFTIVVDDDIDPSNVDDVLWAIATRCDPESSIEIIRGCWSVPVDPVMSPEKRAAGDFTNSRAIIMACKPFHWMKDFPMVNRASDELRAATINKWQDLFPNLTVGN
jgi:4-hydroxy-3-polyprenylbenzoate decarboxylase